MKKAVLKLEIHDDKGKRKAMKAVSDIPGVDSIAIDMKDKKLTVIGNIDAVTITKELRKLCFTEILTVGAAKEEKKEDVKKDEVLEYWKQAFPYPAPSYHVRVIEDDPFRCVIL